MWVLATDIDNTLTGDEAALRELTLRLDVLRRQEQLFLILATGRRLAHVLSGFSSEGLPQADAIISQVGTEIYLPPFMPQMAPMPAWQNHLQQHFSRQNALSFLTGIDGLEMQPDIYNTALKVSVFLDSAPDPPAAVQEIRRRVAGNETGEHYRVVWSSGKHLDIIPAQAGKGNALTFLLDYLRLQPEGVIVAGDSGNDLSMFEACPNGIVVGNAQPELLALRGQHNSRHFFAQAPAAGGVLQGLRHFGVL